ncbi:apoptosis-associated speck-like protein containing a CARD isoform X3 [Genypterus blacodes]|uniref:apoptosis-associated speck-like protein containing a CARD isoform X3 n=1 Tax=Genypterus blacodes TaxID=154954 RepID=UPI003F7579C9
MAPKTKRMAISSMLENLSAKDFRSFGVQLRNRKEEPRVPRNKVEGKDYLDITDVLVSTFTEDGAVREAERILRELCLNDEANDLVKETGGQSSAPGSSDAGGSSCGAAGGSSSGAAGGSSCGAAGGSSSGAAGPPPTVQEVEDFLKNNEEDLIQGVTKINVKQILDSLKTKTVIDQECYDAIFKIRTSQDQMREIFTVIKTQKGKNEFYGILGKKEPVLMDELKKKM